MIIEFCNGGDLDKHLASNGPLNQELSIYLMIDMASAFVYLYSSGVLHRDLKPENVMIHHSGKRAVFKLTDFGLARPVNTDTSIIDMTQGIGTPLYKPPESLC